jgi:hypothetical protein
VACKTAIWIYLKDFESIYDLWGPVPMSGVGRDRRPSLPHPELRFFVGLGDCQMMANVYRCFVLVILVIISHLHMSSLDIANRLFRLHIHQVHNTCHRPSGDDSSPHPNSDPGCFSNHQDSEIHVCSWLFGEDSCQWCRYTMLQSSWCHGQ